jgi:hypothetical protein
MEQELVFENDNYYEPEVRVSMKLPLRRTACTSGNSIQKCSTVIIDCKQFCFPRFGDKNYRILNEASQPLFNSSSERWPQKSEDICSNQTGIIILNYDPTSLPGDDV